MWDAFLYFDLLEGFENEDAIVLLGGWG